jgi:hypothetical protein
LRVEALALGLAADEEYREQGEDEQASLHAGRVFPGHRISDVRDLAAFLLRYTYNDFSRRWLMFGKNPHLVGIKSC